MILTIGFYGLRLAGLLQVCIGYVLLTCVKQDPVRRYDLFQFSYSCYYSGLMMWNAKSIDDLPARDILLPQVKLVGVLILAMFAEGIIETVLRVLLHKPL